MREQGQRLEASGWALYRRLLPTKVSREHITCTVKLKLQGSSRSKEDDGASSNGLGDVVAPVCLEALEDGRGCRGRRRFDCYFGVHADEGSVA